MVDAETLVRELRVALNLCCASGLRGACNAGRHFGGIPRCDSQSSARLDKTDPFGVLPMPVLQI